MTRELIILNIDGRLGAMDWRSLTVNIVALLNSGGGKIQVRDIDAPRLESAMRLAVEAIDPAPGVLILMDPQQIGHYWVRSDGRLYCERYRHGRLGFWKVVEGSEDSIIAMRLGEVASRIDGERRACDKEAT